MKISNVVPWAVMSFRFVCGYTEIREETLVYIFSLEDGGDRFF